MRDIVAASEADRLNASLPGSHFWSVMINIIRTFTEHYPLNPRHQSFGRVVVGLPANHMVRSSRPALGAGSVYCAGKSGHEPLYMQ